ncbi:MAG: hybrid sensor histidine kinase/response regulator [Thainema sp.]
MSSFSTSSENSASKGSILIVDDTPNNLHLLSSMLIEQGYDVRSAINGSIALMAVDKIQPDLILLDINMPQMNGFEVCEKLKITEATQSIPVIFLSAMDETLDKVQAFQVGGADYITKPFRIEEVIVRVERQLELKRLQAALHQANVDALRALEQEKELNRLKSEFVSMISHDFRTPLTTIQACAELIRYSSDQLSSDTKNRYFDKINLSVEHMLDLLDEVLLIGSIEAGGIQFQPSLVNLNQFCHELIEALQVGHNMQHQIHITADDGNVQAMIDPMLLRQILTNLLSNAIKYSPADQPIDFVLNCFESSIEFRICDRGIGIPLDNQTYLFEPFYRCPNTNDIQGTGLGLTIVKRCIDTHQGQIQIESQEGVGTTVIVTLPQ